MTTQEASLVKNNPKEVYPPLTHNVIQAWPTVINVGWELRGYLTHYMLSDTNKNYYHGPAINNFMITGLKPDTEYRFSISGYKDHQGNFTTPTSFTVKTKSSIFPIWTTEVSRTVIDLHWDGGDSGITLEMDGKKVGDFNVFKKSHRFTNLNPGQTYKFRGKLDNSDDWVEYVVKTLRTQPTPPTFLDAYDQTSDRVSLYWDPGTVDGGSIRYRIERDGQLLEIKDRPPYIDTTPEQGRSHVYSVQSMDDQFNLSEKISITVRFGDFTAPTDPSNLSTSHLTLMVKWDESYDSSGEIFYDVDQDGDFLGTTKEQEFAVTGLETGKRYTFGVTAKDPTNNKSNRVTVTYPPVGISFKHPQ
jgi:hypothetical protein